MPRIALPAAALAALTAPALASIPEVLVAETTRSFSYNDAAGFEITSINTFLSINEIPLGDISEIFEDIFILRSVTEASTGAVYVADLTSPALAGPLALLTNGTDDEIWYGGDSDGGGDYRSVTEAALFTGAVGPDGNPITGPDLAGFTPTRAELQIDSLSINWDGSFDTAVSATVTFRFFAEAEPSTALDVGNAEFWDLIADPDNESRTYDLAAALGFPSGSPLLLDSIQWDVVLTTIGASWGSEAQIGFDFDLDGAFELFLTPGVGDDLPVTDQAYSSGGPSSSLISGSPISSHPTGSSASSSTRPSTTSRTRSMPSSVRETPLPSQASRGATPRTSRRRSARSTSATSPPSSRRSAPRTPRRTSRRRPASSISPMSSPSSTRSTRAARSRQPRARTAAVRAGVDAGFDAGPGLPLDQQLGRHERLVQRASGQDPPGPAPLELAEQHPHSGPCQGAGNDLNGPETRPAIGQRNEVEHHPESVGTVGVAREALLPGALERPAAFGSRAVDRAAGAVRVRAQLVAALVELGDVEHGAARPAVAARPQPSPSSVCIISHAPTIERRPVGLQRSCESGHQARQGVSSAATSPCVRGGARTAVTARTPLPFWHARDTRPPLHRRRRHHRP
jgi:hypothetical protein